LSTELAAEPRRDGRVRQPTRFLIEAELLGMHEAPNRLIVDLEAATGKLGYEPRIAKSPMAVLIAQDRQPDSIDRKHDHEGRRY
jgi:hypothetical protein